MLIQPHGFKKAENIDIDRVPDKLKTKEMIQAMSVLEKFSQNQEEYLLYLSRLDAMLEQKTWEVTLERDQKEKEKALKEKEKALKEKERFRKMLKEAGIDPDKKPRIAKKK